jgi:hypothetical protein
MYSFDDGFEISYVLAKENGAEIWHVQNKVRLKNSKIYKRTGLLG